MATEPRFRDLPNLNAYLKERLTEPPLQKRKEITNNLGCLVALAWGVTAFVVLKAQLTTGIAAAISGGSMFLLMAIMSPLFNYLSKPRNEQERRAVETYNTSLQLANISRDKRAARNVDQTAAQLLEAAALHRNRVVQTLNSSAWVAEGLAEHWQAWRLQALKAADDAMEEILFLCKDYFTVEEVQYETDVGELIEALIELDFEDVGESWGRKERRVVTNPGVSQIYDPAYEIASKLKQLAGAVEKATVDLRQERHGVGPGSVTASSIDLALHELQSLRQAEQELDQTEQQQHLGQG